MAVFKKTTLADLLESQRPSCLVVGNKPISANNHYQVPVKIVSKTENKTRNQEARSKFSN